MRLCGAVRRLYVAHEIPSYRTISEMLIYIAEDAETPPPFCPICGKPYLKQFGIGTQVEEQVKPHFPQCSYCVWMRTPLRDHLKILQHLHKKQTCSSAIFRRHDFENVTLVGVLAADSSLYVPITAVRSVPFAHYPGGWRAGRGTLAWEGHRCRPITRSFCNTGSGKTGLSTILCAGDTASKRPLSFLRMPCLSGFLFR